MNSVTNIATAVRHFAAALQEIAEQMTLMVKRFTEVLGGSARLARQMREADIAAYGPRNETHDGEWISDLCAGWVHDSCPSGFCHCKCHFL